MEQLLCMANNLAPQKEKQATASSVMYLELKKGVHRKANVYRCVILCVLNGSITLSYDRFIAENVREGQILLLTPGERCSITATHDTHIILFQTEDLIQTSEGLVIEELPVRQIENYGIPLLNIKQPIRIFIKQLLLLFNDGLYITDFMNLKMKELFYLLKTYYTKEELAGFFYPLYSKNAAFAMFVYKNHRFVKNVTEFARLYNCSISNFDKNFRQTFGTSSYKWMMQRRINMIYNEIQTTQKPLKQIAEDTGFASQPQFTDFCKKHMGVTPGQLRKSKTIAVHNSELQRSIVKQ